MKRRGGSKGLKIDVSGPRQAKWRIPEYYFNDIYDYILMKYGGADELFGDYFDNTLYTKTKVNPRYDNTFRPKYPPKPYFRIKPIVRRFRLGHMDEGYDWSDLETESEGSSTPSSESSFD